MLCRRLTFCQWRLLHRTCATTTSKGTADPIVPPSPVSFSESSMRSVEMVHAMVAERHRDMRVLSKRQKRLLAELMDISDIAWSEVIVQNPKILSMPSAEEVTAIVDALMMRGNCSENAALDFLAVCPVDVMRDRNIFEVNVGNFEIFCRGLKLQWIRLLQDSPNLIYLSWDDLAERKMELEELLQGSDCARAAILSAPNVLLIDVEDLRERVEFFFKTMHVSPKSLAQSGALCYDLEHVRKRYLFLERCGLYRHPHPKTIGIHDSAEPPISAVVDTDLETFLATAAGGLLTREEYELFEKSLSEEAEDGGIVYRAADDYLEEEEEILEGDVDGYRDENRARKARAHKKESWE